VYTLQTDRSLYRDGCSDQQQRELSSTTRPTCASLVRQAAEARAETDSGWSKVTVETDPVGARVFVAGKDRGATPLSFDLDAGSYQLDLRRDGFKPWVTDVQVKANEPLRIGR